MARWDERRIHAPRTDGETEGDPAVEKREVLRASMHSRPAGNRRRGQILSGASRRPPPKSRGQALVEFALLAPLMLLLLAVGVDAGRLFFTWIEVVNSSREGAAYAAGNPTDTSGITVK